MPIRSGEEREHRQGLILGLTLAEVLLLLLFLLLLGLGKLVVDSASQNKLLETQLSDQSRILESERLARERLTPLLDLIKNNPSAALLDIDELIARLAKLDLLEKTIADLRSQLASEQHLSTAIRRKFDAISEVLERAKLINPDDPPSALRKALELLEAVGPETSVAKIKSFEKMKEVNEQFSTLVDALKTRDPKAASDIDQLADKLKSVTQNDNLKKLTEEAAKINPADPPLALKRGLELAEQLGLNVDPKTLSNISALAKTNEDLRKQLQAAEKVRRERDNLMRIGGKGTVYPSCWTAPDGQTEYIFEVDIQDDGLVVKDILPTTRADDPALHLIDNFTRETKIPSLTFKSATAKLFRWSVEKQCRFFVTLRDGTGPNSKQQYKTQRQLVEGHFYIRLVGNNAVSNDAWQIGVPR